MQRKIIRYLVNGLILSFLLTLTGCSTIVTKHEPVKISPPYQLVVVEEIPSFVGSTNEDLLMYARLLQSQRQKDIVDKNAIKDWFDSLSEPYNEKN